MAVKNDVVVENGLETTLKDTVLQNKNVKKASLKNGCNIELGKSITDLTEKRVRLEWKDICVETVSQPPTCLQRIKKCFRNDRQVEGPQPIQILKNVSGVAEPGSLLAIMGSSGAGKTTLLNVLSKQNLMGVKVNGTVLVNNNNMSQKIKTISAYVQQEELFVGTLTVKEHLTFQALLRMGSSYTRKEKLKRVADVITQLGLLKCQDTLIGIQGRIPGISGGELKRLSFASEVITNPTIMFVDEPTSGLDSFMAESSVQSLQQLASEGKTIVATIHQPSSEVFQLFSRLLLMSNGRTAFLGSTKEAEVFFRENDYPCPLNFNPADHYIRTLAMIPGKDEECRITSNKLCDAYDNGVYKSNNSLHKEEVDDMDGIYRQKIYKEDSLTQYRSLLWRSSKACQREPYVNTLRMFQTIAVALVCGFAFLNQFNDQDGTRNVNGALFFIALNLTFANALSVIFVFPAELPIFLKENKYGMYRLGVYFMARTIAELPWYILSTFIYSTITYWMIGLRNDTASYFIYVGLCQLIVQCSISYGLMISSIAPTVQVALSVTAPLLLPLVLFGGFFMIDGSVPVYFIWVKFISWIKYSFEALLINQWKDFGPIGCTHKNSTHCLANGDAVLTRFGYENIDFNRNIAALLALVVGFRLLAFLFVLMRSYRSK